MPASQPGMGSPRCPPQLWARGRTAARRPRRDGVTARRRALERFCGLGRELDGSAFDEAVWRRTLESLSLDEITRHLRAYEVRFDHKFPPSPTSYPETLPDSESGAWTNRAMGIVRDG